MAETLSKREAYAAMYTFLEQVYERTESDDLLLKDGGTADPAAWHDWEVAVAKVRSGETHLELDLRDDG
jgi:hypothetical protein